MAITQALCNSYKVEVMHGIHSTAHTYKLALYNSSAVLSKATTGYTTVCELADGVGGYTAGGIALTGTTANLDADTAYLDFDDASLSPATITARGGLIYNTSAGNKAVAVIDFSTDITATNGTFTIQFPAPAAATALVRIA